MISFVALFGHRTVIRYMICLLADLQEDRDDSTVTIMMGKKVEVARFG